MYALCVAMLSVGGLMFSAVSSEFCNCDKLFAFSYHISRDSDIIPTIFDDK